MSDRLAAADAAFKAGRRDEGIEALASAIADDPARPANVYNALLVQLYQAGRHEEGATWAERAAAEHPRDLNIANIHGVLLRRLGRLEDALVVLDRAVRLDPRNEAPALNRCNVLLDLGRGPPAEEGLTRLVRQNPRHAEYQRLLGRALVLQDRREPALVRFRQATTLNKQSVEAWLDLAGALNELDRAKQAEESLDKALAANPGQQRLIEAKVVVMRRAGQHKRADAYLQDMIAQHGEQAYLHHQLGLTVAEADRARGNVHFRRAVELAPDNRDFRVALIESLERTRTGDEGANIEESYQLAKAALDQDASLVDAGPGAKKVLFEVLQRVADYDAITALGDFRTRGREWAESGRHTALFKQLSLVESEADRQELLEQHRIWARKVEARAAEAPIRRPKPRAPDGRIRLGLMSSDLRGHPVGYFAMPLFEAVDPRFDLYAYSFNLGGEDGVQKYMASKSTFRWRPDIGTRDAAQMIADDQLDILIELGGSTFMNKLEVMAYKPAPRQASWLGYPHSAGLSTIDYLVVDPYLMPERPELILEKPLMLPNAWYPLGAFHFRPEPAADPVPPVARNGYVTFGTANNPQKYTPRVVDAWARVLRETPESRFLFVRPEGGTASFRENLCARFAAGGVAPERILFEPVRGAHMPHYNRIDITLDCFPQTGGTTTCESLWMGAPCVTLVGDSVFERLSYSTLMNLGLGDLCARTLDDYVAVAARIAADPARIAALRSTLRQRMQQSPLGQTQTWARDFYEAVAKVVG
jgi:predicted O-linked N-acetylglucosamine transferase (SPINDLY family)